MCISFLVIGVFLVWLMFVDRLCSQVKCLIWVVSVGEVLVL